MNVDKYVVEKAAEHAAALLSPLGKRWRHVQGVVQRAYSMVYPKVKTKMDPNKSELSNSKNVVTHDR